MFVTFLNQKLFLLEQTQHPDQSNITVLPSFPHLQDEKNQMMTTNVWLKQVCSAGKLI